MKVNRKWEETKQRLAAELSRLTSNADITRKWTSLNRPTIEDHRVYFKFSHRNMSRLHRDIYFTYESQTDSVICKITNTENMMQKLKWVNKNWINKCIGKLKEVLQDG